MVFFLKQLFKNKNTATLPKKLYLLLGFKPTNQNLYQEAFTHPAQKIKTKEGNPLNFERLEFLGDAILSGIVADYLYKHAPNKKEGYLTKIRSKIVSRKNLNSIGEQLRLIEFLEVKSGINLGVNINGNLLEALVGAIYLDQGYHIAEKFIAKHILNDYKDLAEVEKTIISHKGLILEWAQKTRQELNFNTFEEQNAEEIIVFVSIVRVNQKVVAKGRGSSKKKAEETASKRAYYKFKQEIQAI